MVDEEYVPVEEKEKCGSKEEYEVGGKYMQILSSNFQPDS